jgi:tRNA (guanine37-N1)-methyltransferase
MVKGVLGKETSLKDESFRRKGYKEYPQYTRPKNFRGWKVPKVLLGGNHKEIEKWRKKMSNS